MSVKITPLVERLLVDDMERIRKDIRMSQVQKLRAYRKLLKLVTQQ